MTETMIATARPTSPRARNRGRMQAWTWVALAAACLVAVPVMVVAASVFVPTGEVWRHLAETVLGDYIVNSLWLMIGVGLGTLVIGTGAAWLVTMCRFPFDGLFAWALLLPLAVPAYMIAYTYTGLLDFAGPVQSLLRDIFDWSTRRDYWFPSVRSLGGAVVMMTLVLYPYVYMLARSAFTEQTAGMLEAGRTLGKGPWGTFATIALPLARPSIAAGLALALMETLNDFGTVHYFAVDTFTTGIYRTWLGRGQPAAAAQLGACLMIFIVSLLYLERKSRGRAHYHAQARRQQAPRKYILRGLPAFAAMAACALPVFFGFALPALVLAWWSMGTLDSWTATEFVQLAWNSFSIAAITACCAVACAVVLAYGARLGRSKITSLAVRAAGLGYAIPGSIIAVGVLLPFAWLDNGIDALAKAVFGTGTGLLLTGTAAALVFGYMVRFLSVSLGSVEAGLARVTPSMDAAARTLGHTPGATLIRVHLPIIRASLLTAGVLVFVDVMKELPATLIMRPFNFDTLAVRAFELASDEQLAEASAPALTIVAVGILPVILISRAINRSRSLTP